jgi:hypothetical protein
MKRFKTAKATLKPNALETVARQHVNVWIESGLTTGEMRDRVKSVVSEFEAFLARDVRYFGETGKYPRSQDQD